MSKQSTVMVLANRMARKLVAEQTRARLMMGFDAAIIAAHEVFQFGPGRAAAFSNAYNDAMEQLATLYVSDCDENKDKKIDYAKGTRDALIKKIVGPDNFVPFDKAYGEAYMDELKRFRMLNKRAESEWISADEKPEPFETVDLAILGRDGYFTSIGCFEHGAWTVYTGKLLSDETVTHWKPRPEPPEVLKQ